MQKSTRKAFTLVELLVVVAVIGILFVVLLSKVDFATDKAKATGVQTDFRSFQLAIETVAKENAGLNTFGWDEGDTNGDRIRNSYDEGDLNKDGVCNSYVDTEDVDGDTNTAETINETFTGRMVYDETWTGVYTLKNPADANDKTAIAALEAAINKNLDPKLHISIADDYKITMANQARDPWKNEYFGRYLTNASAGSTTNTSKNAVVDGLDRGAIIMYSMGANGEIGCVEDVLGGEVVVSILQPSKEATTVAGETDYNTAGKDDYSIAVIYTYKNGYGEIISTTTGFSNNQ